MTLRGQQPVFTQLFREDWGRQAEVSGRPDGVYTQADLCDSRGHLAVERAGLGGGEQPPPKTGLKRRLQRPLEGMLRVRFL